MKNRGIFERPKESGIWWIRYTDQFGKLHREKVGPKSLAIQAYQKRKTEIREGKFFPEKVHRKRRQTLFKDMANMYFEEHSRVNKRSWKTDKYNLSVLVSRFGDMTLSEIRKQDVERLRAQLTRKLAPATVNRYMALLKSLFNKAIEWGKCEHNPVRGIKQFKETHRIRYLTEEEEAQLEGALTAQYWPWVEMAFHTGMRRSEQFNLRWENINFQTRIITIPQSMVKHGEMRHIPMNDRVVQIFREFPSRLTSPWVFPSKNGSTPMDANNFVRRVFVPALKQAGTKDFRWHDLRHTFASRLVMKRTDIRTVQELMGHKTITMTQKYSHLSPAHRMEAVQRLVNKPTDTKTDTSAKGRLQGRA